VQRYFRYIRGEKIMSNIVLASWISTGITFFAVMSFSLYFNYRFSKMIKMLDEMITERPE
jgi:hypothetical protein